MIHDQVTDAFLHAELRLHVQSISNYTFRFRVAFTTSLLHLFSYHLFHSFTVSHFSPCYPFLRINIVHPPPQSSTEVAVFSLLLLISDYTGHFTRLPVGPWPS